MSTELIQIPDISIETIKNYIYIVRGQRVMLDRDLAELYNVETGRLNEAVKRNIERFPEDFMFRLEKQDIDSLRSQIATLKTGRGQHSKYMPYAFTELGIAMLSSVLRSSIAIQVNINIMRAFVAIRSAMSAMMATDMKVEKLSLKVDQLNARVDEILHEQNETNTEVAVQLAALNDALDEIREKPAKPRTRIGYKTSKDK